MAVLSCALTLASFLLFALHVEQLYFLQRCSITVNCAGRYSSSSLCCVPIHSISSPHTQRFSAADKSCSTTLRGSALGRGLRPHGLRAGVGGAAGAVAGGSASSICCAHNSNSLNF